MKIGVTGSSGLVGSALVPFLTDGGHTVTRFVRTGPANGGIIWDPMAGQLDARDIDGLDAVVHLAGENIAGRRWNAIQKGRIRDSRVKGTQLLCTALAGIDHKPKVLMCASAIGFYGDRGGMELDEESSAGGGFLAEVCRPWEAACQPASDAGIRVVNLRLGVVLGLKGGALAKMLTPFKLGVGGVIGDGTQYWSWISLDDAVGAIQHTLLTDSLAGPVNGVAPGAVTNREFTKTLGRVLRRPTIVPMPAFAARAVLGEMADALLLASTHVKPKRLVETGYQFRYPTLESALRSLLGRAS